MFVSFVVNIYLLINKREFYRCEGFENENSFRFKLKFSVLFGLTLSSSGSLKRNSYLFTFCRCSKYSYSVSGYGRLSSSSFLHFLPHK